MLKSSRTRTNDSLQSTEYQKTKSSQLVTFPTDRSYTTIWVIFCRQLAPNRLCATQGICCAGSHLRTERDMSRHVCVIGAGAAGLTSIKSCLEEGLQPTCFERSEDIGGLWRFKDAPEPGSASIYRSLVVNTSKEMMCFSDFPMPADYPNYMMHSQILQYLRLYAQQFDLLRHITFQTSVQSVRQRPDFRYSGQWEVVTENSKGEKETHIFDGILVCSGHFTVPFLPLAQFPGHEAFPGRCLHSWEYKDAEAFRGKRVMVVGIGNSGADIAVEISRNADKSPES
ncbi:hypothetical protein UPYG_G00028570 [Umbra pygmaea]|uniref:Flavin-containing monooxygenase n=1 Tax=Umbra pygmaea TaxID=75934 RepID=A0ABD0XM92_UMBPY